MAVLNAWQKIDRVVSGLPFGNGSAGNTTISSDPNTRATASGTSGSASLTIGSAILSNGDVFIIWQAQGTGNGQWEVNKVLSGGGSTSITCQKTLQYTYGTGAQVVKFTMYDVVGINSFTTTAWNGSTGGITVICGRTSITINTSQTITGGGGFVGGARAGDPGSPGSGEGASGNPGSQATGAGQGAGSGSVGSGGGYGTAGGGANGGSAYGSADLTTLQMGGGGSGASANPSTNASNGASSGSVIIYITKNFVATGDSNSGGYGSSNATDRSGGGGSGSSTLVVCQTATLNTNKLVAAGGSAGSASSQGTSGGVGRIAIHHQDTVTGTTNPTFDDTTETTLKETGGGFFTFI